MDIKDVESLIGRILFFPRGYAFYKLLSVFDLEPDFQKSGRRIKLLNIADGKEEEFRFLQEIGTEFFVVPPDYPKAKIDAFLEAAKLPP